jgi:hypothetical protein
VIPYPILFEIIAYEYEEPCIAYRMSYHDEDNKKIIYVTDWNQEISFDFTGINLKKVYEKIISSFIKS